ncbi:MAG: glycoside hydrolase family 43 protein [Eubacteriales bacterium]|nr:glycoside hydrolase family 43 protein [Eubacteriales bacterium]
MRNGTCWLDDQGHTIQAHGGMITRFHEKWYWYGENKDADNCKVNGRLLSRVDVRGVSCYSSDDLHLWHHEGIVLPAEPTDPSSPLYPGKVCERPKVIYCEHTGKYVMWFHSDAADYTLANAACATSDTPVGPFTLQKTVTPNRRDCRDMTLFQDEGTGMAYLIHSGDWNKTLYLSQLDETFTDFTGVCFEAFPGQEREAPAFFKRQGLYYSITSGCTGWAPNSALYAVGQHLSNGLKLIDNPCEGEGCHETFGGQSTYIFEDQQRYYLMLDHWKPMDLRNSGYSILPIAFEKERMIIRWTDEF